MKLVTWNVNSLTARLGRVLAFLDEHGPDVVCLQETKVDAEAFPHGALEEAGYRAADHSGGRWAGVAVLARSSTPPVDVQRGLVGEPDAGEARWVEATVGSLRVASVYVPNGRVVGSETYAMKLEFLEAMAARASALAQSAAVIAGDMNVCPTDRDVYDRRAFVGSTHVTPAERERLQAIIESGFVDAYRRLHPDERGFTWWDYRAGHFHKGLGLRIDLALVTGDLADTLVSAGIDRDYRKPSKVPDSKPSDHAPLIVEFDPRTGRGSRA